MSMTNEEAKRNLAYAKRWGDKPDDEALDKAMKALELMSHLKNRPCSACEYHKENGCCKWSCVFEK